jgi:hypothetical protein
VYGFTSSSLIRQVAAGGDIDRLHRLLPRLVIQRLREKKASGGLSIVRHDGLKD